MWIWKGNGWKGLYCFLNPCFPPHRYTSFIKKLLKIGVCTLNIFQKLPNDTEVFTRLESGYETPWVKFLFNIWLIETELKFQWEPPGQLLYFANNFSSFSSKNSFKWNLPLFFMTTNPLSLLCIPWVVMKRKLPFSFITCISLRVCEDVT